MTFGTVVSPACAGMILDENTEREKEKSEPRMRGDDPPFRSMDILDIL